MIDDYFKLLQEVHDHFGYVEDWCVFPLVDHREYYWVADDNEVQFSPRKDVAEALAKADYWDQIPEEMHNEVYSDEIYYNRFLPKAVYKAEDYTMILVDTNTDGNKFLSIFDNKKEIKE